jgi:hypothetical protein
MQDGREPKKPDPRNKVAESPAVQEIDWSTIAPPALLDTEWERIKKLRPLVPDQQRERLDLALNGYKLERLLVSRLQRVSRGKLRSRSEKLKDLQKPASRLLSALERMDHETLEALAFGSVDWDFPSDLRAKLSDLLALLKIANENVDKRKSGPSADAFVQLVQRWDFTLRDYNAGHITRPNYGDVAVIAKAAARITGETIGNGTIDRAVSRVVAARRKRAAAETHSRKRPPRGL